MLVHGLNMKPSKMDALAKLLRSSHINTLRVALTGHRGDPTELQSVTRKKWLQDFADAYADIEARALKENAPQHFIGFSLGGTLVHDFLLERSDAHFDRMVLLAPAIALTRRATLIRLLELLRPLGHLMIPSLSHPLYQANAGTSIAAYNALLDSYHRIHRKHFRASNIPTLVVTDPEDELVNADGIDHLIAHNSLNRWTTMRVTHARNTLRLKYHHLITDPDALGEEEWERVASAIQNHLL